MKSTEHRDVKTRSQRSTTPEGAIPGWSFALKQLVNRLLPKTKTRKLQVVEITPLGEKRFVAVVRFGREKFLIGGAASSVVMLTKLGSTAVPQPTPIDISAVERIAL